MGDPSCLYIDYHQLAENDIRSLLVPNPSLSLLDHFILIFCVNIVHIIYVITPHWALGASQSTMCLLIGIIRVTTDTS